MIETVNQHFMGALILRCVARNFLREGGLLFKIIHTQLITLRVFKIFTYIDLR